MSDTLAIVLSLLAVVIIGIFIWCYLKHLKEKKADRKYASTLATDQNVAFYSNRMKSRPEGDYIENILNSWKGNYGLLERNHNFIQWLFPNYQPGVNKEASVLTDEEAKTIQGTPELRRRVKSAFELMLDFYGMELSYNNQFQLSRNHCERLLALNKWGNHNFQRISRILLALKVLGHKDLMQPWMKFLADLIYKEKVLNHAASSFEDYWLDTLDAVDKIQLNIYVDQMQLDE